MCGIPMYIKEAGDDVMKLDHGTVWNKGTFSVGLAAVFGRG